MRSILIIAFFSIWHPLFAEDLPTLSTLALAMVSPEIWEAEPLYFDSAVALEDRTRAYETKWLRVRITRILRGARFQPGDTVWVDASASFAWPKSFARGYLENDWHVRDKVGRLLLFGNGHSAAEYHEWYGKSLPGNGALCVSLSLSGVRMLDRQENVYVPWQADNPGPYYFFRDTSLRWPALLERAAYDIRRVDTLFALRRIEIPWVQNDSLLAWIKRHAAELSNRYHPDSWEWYQNLPFNWIWSNNIHHQAWEAVLLHRRLFPEEIPARSEWSELGEELPIPFADAAGLQFLMDKMRDTTLEPALHTAALHFFSNACWDNQLSDSDRATIFGEVLKLYPTLDKAQRSFAVNAATLLAFDFEGNKRVPGAIPFFVETRRLEAPGDLRNTLSETIVKNSTAAEWLAVSGNEGRVLVTLYHFYYDSLKQTLRFFFYQRFGVEGLYEQPLLEFYQLNEQGKPVHHREMPLPVTYPKVDWEKASLRSHGAASVEVPVSDIPRGEWHFRARGTAGADLQYRWVSEPAVFSF